MDFMPVPKPRLWKSKADFFKPFRTAAADAGENIVPLYDPEIRRHEVEDLDLKDLNTSLAVLVDLFPDVQPEVFREMLISVGEESRLQIVTEHLLARDDKWVRGRNRTLANAPLGKLRGVRTKQVPLRLDDGLLDEDCFRGTSYKKAVKQVLYQEFKILTHASIRAVLAEHNFSYTLARPVLQQLASKTWRFSIPLFWSRKSPSVAASDHPCVVWQTSSNDDGRGVPALRRTGSASLDQELHDLFVAPILEQQRRTLLEGDYSLAVALNDKEAEIEGALFDCECCYNSVAFERLATCDDGCHQLCFDCVRRTVSEGLFGQGWARVIDLKRSTVRCFSPAASECSGIIAASVSRRALAQSIGKEDLWNEFQNRAAAEALTKSRLPFQRCPSCSYVEVNDTPDPRRRDALGVWHHILARAPAFTMVLLLLGAMISIIFAAFIAVLAYSLWLVIEVSPTASAVLKASWSRVYKLRRGLKFQCQAPSCSRTSCMRCRSAWRDPHICFESEKTSLRIAIESSATAAVKRTCPKCLLSFVKASGCNKLVCNCGYTMCYICRQEITSKEGYGHFCQHFRPQGGRCAGCERCDLYGDEDEEATIRTAAEAAEKAWREREGGKDGDERAAKAMAEVVVGKGRELRFCEVWLDAVIDCLII